MPDNQYDNTYAQGEIQRQILVLTITKCLLRQKRFSVAQGSPCIIYFLLLCMMMHVGLYT